MIPGKIVITDKVNFEYYKLEKPPPSYHSGCHLGYRELKLRKYEASKQLVEVENVFKWDESEIWTYTSRYYKEFDAKEVINNQNCTAEIKGKKATIIELTKK